MWTNVNNYFKLLYSWWKKSRTGDQRAQKYFSTTCRVKDTKENEFLVLLSMCRLKSHSWGSSGIRKRNETSQIIRERKVIVIFFSFIITLSTEHFSSIRHVIYFCLKPYRTERIENNFSKRYIIPETCTNVDSFVFIFILWKSFE